MNKKYISWQKLEAHISSICQQIYESKWRPEIIVGVGRGGLVPSTMLSHWLGVPHKSLDVSLRDFADCCTDCDLAGEALKGTSILIVDDINDSGETLDWIMNDWKECCLPNDPKWDNVFGNTVRFATVVDNLASDFTLSIDYTGVEINKAEHDAWIVFPWENWWTTVD